MSDLDLRRAVGLLKRITKYAREDRARTPGTTRLARVLTETEAFLYSIRAEATAERCQRCNGAGMRPCECGCGPMPCECRARHRSAPVTAEAAASLCYEGDCAKMTGRSRPCPIHDAPTPRAELTGEERAVLEAVASIPAQELRSSGNWYGWAKPIGEAELARRAAARKEGKP